MFLTDCTKAIHTMISTFQGDVLYSSYSFCQISSIRSRTVEELWSVDSREIEMEREGDAGHD